VFAACPRLKIVSVWGTGTDNIDLNAAGMRGVTVCNTPGINAFAVAEHALTLMLAVGRRIVTLDAEMRHGRWPREMLTQLLGKTLGVFGMGAIGGRLATIARGIGMNVLGWSALGDEGRIRKTGAKPASKEQILSTADVVSLHVRLTTETRNFLGRKELAMMKPSAILVNTGRGALVDREALLAALRERRLLGAGLDVFHQEPLAPDDPILSLPNVIVSPHNAGQTPEVIRDGLLAAVANIENYLSGKPSNLVVSPGR
jgi:phosphoglycerate dehydrogenase-like enzyme